VAACDAGAMDAAAASRRTRNEERELMGMRVWEM